MSHQTQSPFPHPPFPPSLPPCPPLPLAQLCAYGAHMPGSAPSCMYDNADASCIPYFTVGPNPRPPPHLFRRSRREPPERYSRQMKLEGKYRPLGRRWEEGRGRGAADLICLLLFLSRLEICTICRAIEYIHCRRTMCALRSVRIDLQAWYKLLAVRRPSNSKQLVDDE